jgi:hypothetical protein
MAAKSVTMLTKLRSNGKVRTVLGTRLDIGADRARIVVGRYNDQAGTKNHRNRRFETWIAGLPLSQRTRAELI